MPMMNSVVYLTATQLTTLGRAKNLDSLLTPAEQRVLKQASLGRTTKEIANTFGNSPKTIERHIEQYLRQN